MNDPRRLINVFHPSLQREELDAAARVFQSNRIGKGAVTASFEAAFAASVRVDRTLVRTVDVWIGFDTDTRGLRAYPPGH